MAKSMQVTRDVAALLRSKVLVWIVTKEEARVERYLVEAAASASYATRTWDICQGICDMGGKKLEEFKDCEEPMAAMNMIEARSRDPMADRCVWIMRDLAPSLMGPMGMTPLRRLRNLMRVLPITPNETAQGLVVLSSATVPPPELEGDAVLVNWPLPDAEEVGEIMQGALDVIPDEKFREAATPKNGDWERAVEAAIGLNGISIQATFGKSLVQKRRIDPELVATEKKRLIKGAGLEWIDPIPGGLEAVGGLKVLKDWLIVREAAFTPAARAYGLPKPKGALLFGVQGCGKTLTAKAISTAWKRPLIKADLGAMKGKYVGQSEENIRDKFRTIEAIGPCVLLCDEIEKTLAGATQGAADGGTSSDQLGFLLGWMQDNQSGAFVLATANNPEALPPELVRKGRFDEVWFIDLPTFTERVGVLMAALRKYGRNDEMIDLDTVAKATRGFTGSEIESLVPEAMFAAFNDSQRPITTEDLLAAAGKITPLSRTYKERIEKLREWARGRARNASAPEEEETALKAQGRALDL